MYYYQHKVQNALNDRTILSPHGTCELDAISKKFTNSCYYLFPPFIVTDQLKMKLYTKSNRIQIATST